MNQLKAHDCVRRPHALMWTAALTAWLVYSIPVARAELQIEITSGVRDPVPIAIVPFAHREAAPSDLDVADIVQHDLEGSGRDAQRGPSGE